LNFPLIFVESNNWCFFLFLFIFIFGCATLSNNSCFPIELSINYSNWITLLKVFFDKILFDLQSFCVIRDICWSESNIRVWDRLNSSNHAADISIDNDNSILNRKFILKVSHQNIKSFIKIWITILFFFLKIRNFLFFIKKIWIKFLKYFNKLSNLFIIWLNFTLEILSFNFCTFLILFWIFFYFYPI